MAATIKVIVSTEGGLDKVKQDIGGLGDTASKAGGGFSGLREVATGALREIGSLAVDALGKAAQAVGGFLKDSVSVAGDFQAGMQEFQAVAGKGVDTAGLAQFHDLFISLGKELPVSTADVQKAAIELVKGGIDPATIAAGGLRQSIQFAAAAMGGDLAAAAEVGAKVVGGWADVTATAQEKADLLTHSTDLLTKAANASTVDVHDLALGLYNVQGTAKTMGLSLDETTTTLAELAPRFSNANTAGTSMRNMLIRLQPTTTSATDAMQALGLITEDGGNKFFDANGKFVGVAKASELLKNSLTGLTDAERTQALQTIFGNDAMNAAAALADMGADGYNNMAAALENANGVSGNAQLKQQGLNTAMENFKGSVEALQITLGEQFLPILTDVFNNYLAPAVNTVTTFADAVFGSDDAFNKLTPDLQALVTVIDAVVQGFNENGLRGALEQLIPGIGGFLDSANQVAAFVQSNLHPILAGLAAMIIVVVVPAFIAWATTASATAIATVAALAPVIAPILAIGAAVGLLVAAWENDWGGIRTTTTAFWEGTGRPIFEALENWLSDKLTAATQALADFWNNTLKPAFNAVWSFLNTYVIPLLTALADVHMALVQRAAQEMADFWNNTLKPAFNAVSDFLSGTLGPIFDTLSGKHLADTLAKSEALSSFWNDTLQPALRALGAYLSDALGPAWKGVTDAVASFSSWVGGLGAIIEGAISWLHKLADTIRGTPSMPSGAGGGSPPGFAKGVENFTGGLAYVHAGEVLMNLKAGTSVIPADQSRQMFAPSYVTNNITNNLNFAPRYSSGGGVSMDYAFAKTLAGVV